MPTFQPYTIPGTCTQLNGGEHILTFSGPRFVVTNKPLEVIKKYKKLGFNLLLAALFVVEWPGFVMLDKKLNDRKKLDANLAWELGKAILNGKVSFE